MSADHDPIPETRRQRRERIAAQTAARYAGLAQGHQITQEPIGAAPWTSRLRRPVRAIQRYQPKLGMARDRRGVE